MTDVPVMGMDHRRRHGTPRWTRYGEMRQMLDMNDYNRGDIMLVRYQASAGEEYRLRPALVVSTETYHRGREQMVVSAVTSSQRAPQTGDTVVESWQKSGLLGPSLVTGVLLTITPDSIERRLGSLEQEDLHAVESSLRVSLGL